MVFVPQGECLRLGGHVRSNGGLHVKREDRLFNDKQRETLSEPAVDESCSEPTANGNTDRFQKGVRSRSEECPVEGGGGARIAAVLERSLRKGAKTEGAEVTATLWGCGEHVAAVSGGSEHSALWVSAREWRSWAAVAVDRLQWGLQPSRVWLSALEWSLLVSVGRAWRALPVHGTRLVVGYSPNLRLCCVACESMSSLPGQPG